jgi:hypothetical protein
MEPLPVPLPLPQIGYTAGFTPMTAVVVTPRLGLLHVFDGKPRERQAEYRTGSAAR